MAQKNTHSEEDECDVKMFGSVTVWTKGQVVIPKEIRDSLGIEPGDVLMVVTKHGTAIGMIKADDMPAFMEYMQGEIGNKA